MVYLSQVGNRANLLDTYWENPDWENEKLNKFLLATQKSHFSFFAAKNTSEQ